MVKVIFSIKIYFYRYKVTIKTVMRDVNFVVGPETQIDKWDLVVGVYYSASLVNEL